MLLVKQRLARLVPGWVTQGCCGGAVIGWVQVYYNTQYFLKVIAKRLQNFNSRGSLFRYSDKTDQKKRTTFQDKTDHVSGQNGPRFRTKRPSLHDKMDHVSGQNEPRLRTNRTESTQNCLLVIRPRTIIHQDLW